MEALFKLVSQALGVEKIDENTDLSQLTIMHNTALNDKIEKERKAGRESYEKDYLKTKGVKHKSIDDYFAESAAAAKAAAMEELKKTPDERVTKLQADYEAQLQRTLAIEKERDEIKNSFESYKSTQSAQSNFSKLADDAGFVNDKESAFIVFNSQFKIAGETVVNHEGETVKKPNGLPVNPKEFFEQWATKVYPAGWKKAAENTPARGRGGIDSPPGQDGVTDLQKQRQEFFKKNPGASNPDYQRHLVELHKQKKQ